MLKIKRPKTKKEYSKIWITTWQSFVMFWCSVYFIVDIIFNHAEHSVELCTTLVVSIAAIFIPYLAKSYFSKKEEEKNRIYIEGLENAETIECEESEDDLK